MSEGLEVTITYRGAKYNQVVAPTTPSSEFAILKKDLAHLRVHSPSQKNVRRVHGSFILHWPMAGATQKLAGLADSLHTRWFKLCSDDPEALKLREFLSIGSITMKQDGVLIRSTTGKEQASQDAPPSTLAERLGDSLPETRQQLVPVPTPSVSVKRSPPIIPPPRVPPVAPRFDRQTPPHLKRRMSSDDGPSNSTRQKLDVPEASTAPSPQSIDILPQQPQPPASPKADQQGGPSTPVDATKSVPQPTQDDADAVPSTHAHSPAVAPEPQPTHSPPSRESGETAPHPIATRGLGASSAGPGPAPRPSSLHPSPRSACPASPHSGSSSLGGGDLHGPRRREPDVNRLTRELWDTRRQLTAMQAREQVLLDDLERLGARPESTGVADRNGGSRDELAQLEADLRAERARRVRAERALSDVQRECREPFVVPALFRAFLSIAELSE